MADEEVVQRLDLILATLRLAFAPQLREARDEMRGNPVTAAILDATEDWTASTGIQSTVAKKTGAHAATVRARLSELADQGVLAGRGTERKMEYRRTALI